VKHDIVRDQPMPTLDEIEHAFRSCRSRAATKSSHAEHVGQRAVDGGARAKRHRETLEPT